MKVDYLKNIKDTHTLSLQSIVGLKSDLKDRNSEIANLKMKNIQLGLELGKSTDAVAELKATKSKLQKKLEGLNGSIESKTKALTVAESKIISLEKELEQLQHKDQGKEEKKEEKRFKP